MTGIPGKRRLSDKAYDYMEWEGGGLTDILLTGLAAHYGPQLADPGVPEQMLEIAVNAVDRLYAAMKGKTR